MPVNILSVRLETEDDAMLSRLKNKQQQKELFNMITEDTGSRLANRAASRMHDILSPGHRFNVGATGGASQNFGIKKMSDAGGRVVFVVYEGSDTKANYFIRHGFKGTKNNREIPLDKIKTWAAHKGVTLRTDDDSTTRYIKSKSKYGKPYVRAYKQRDQATAALLRIKAYLERRGSGGSHWRELYPKGSPRFDYVAYVGRRSDKMWQDELRKSRNIFYTAYVDYIATGKVPAGGRTFKQY